MRLCIATVLLVAVLAAPASAAPGRSVEESQLAAAMTCSPNLAGAPRAPVLLVHGTGATGRENWSWTYVPAFDALGIPWCWLDMPDRGTGDIQINGEYVAFAIRTMYRTAGRRIAIIGHSQGGMVPRWALKFWPRTRAMVDDLIGFAPSNHGSTQAERTCGDGACSAAGWQQWNVSSFLRVLNEPVETWPGISYTNIITRSDQVVTPPTSGFLSTGEGRITNVATQDVCPGAFTEHILVGLVDPTAYALAMDALDHDGPADPSRVGLDVCLRLFHPGIDPGTGLPDGLEALSSFSGYTAEQLPAEPTPACYVTGAGSPLRLTVRVRRLRDPRAVLGGRPVSARVRGRKTVVRVNLRPFARGPVELQISGRTPAGRRVTVTRTYERC